MRAIPHNDLPRPALVTPSALGRVWREAVAAVGGRREALNQIPRVQPMRSGRGWRICLSVQINGAGVRPGARQHLSRDWGFASSGGGWAGVDVGPFASEREAQTALHALPHFAAESEVMLSRRRFWREAAMPVASTLTAQWNVAHPGQEFTPEWVEVCDGVVVTLSVRFPDGNEAVVRAGWADQITVRWNPDDSGFGTEAPGWHTGF